MLVLWFSLQTVISLALETKKFERGLSDGELMVVKRFVENEIRAVEWSPKSGWVHHNLYNIIDSFGLDYDSALESLQDAMLAQNLTMIE